MRFDRAIDFLKSFNQRFLAVFVFLLLWEIIPKVGIVNPIFLPPFSKVAAALWELLQTGEIFIHLGISLIRSIQGFFLGLCIAIPLGLIIGWFKTFESYIDFLMQTFRQTSTLALLPVFMLLFGIGETSKIAVITWGVIWAVLLNTISGVKNIDPLLIKAARSMGIRSFRLFVKVIFPAALPYILTGIRLSATTSILVLIAAEMMGASKGLGYLIYFTEGNFLIPKMYATIITMSALGLIVNYSLVGLEKSVLRYKEDSHAKV